MTRIQRERFATEEEYKAVRTCLIRRNSVGKELSLQGPIVAIMHVNKMIYDIINYNLHVVHTINYNLPVVHNINYNLHVLHRKPTNVTGMLPS